MWTKQPNLWMDPPTGWKYGFPLIKLATDERSMEEWMHDMGYPANLEPDYIRMWEATNAEIADPLNTARPKYLSDGQLDSDGC